MTTVLILVLILSMLMAIKPSRQIILGFGVFGLALLPIAWTIFIVYVIVHFVRKFW